MRTAHYGTIRKFKTKNFTVTVDAYEEDMPVDVDDEGETAQAVADGKYLHFQVECIVKYKGREIGADYLGGCIYESIESFMDHKECGKQNREWAAQGKEGRCGSYFSDMIHEAISAARKELLEAKQIYIRS